MRRILIAMLACSLAALVVPAAASAHHHRHHGLAHRARAHRHHRHAHMVVIAPAAAKPAVETPPTSEPVATVASFEEGVLKITLPDGSTVSGKVTETTSIGCGCSHDFQGGAPGFQHEGSPWQHDNGDDNNQGDFQHDDEQGPTQSEECGVSALVAGAKVKEAELSVSGAGAFWEKVELYPKS